MNLNNISPEIERIIEQSRSEAKRLGLSEVHAEHLLIALMRDNDSEGNKMLISMNVTAAHIEEKVAEKQYDSSLTNVIAEGDSDDCSTLPLDSDCERILRLTELEARMLRASTADGRHLVLAILHDAIGSSAKHILSDCNVNYRKASTKMGQRAQDDSSSAEIAKNSFSGDEEREYVNAGNVQSDNVKEDDSETPFINQYGRDLTAAAAAGAMDPLVGRTDELQRVAQILQRRKKNNPILVGDPGAGKSAIVEGLSQLIVEHRAGPSLEGKRIVALDMAQIVAGTQYRGQFEERLRRLIDELRKHTEIILFIDEIHTIVGAGSSSGTLDAANILKPALARGEIRCIGATTTAEYRKTIEKDGALERRFQRVMVAPTTAEETLSILRNIKDRYEHHHKVSYTDDALQACVKLTERYITSRCLPDKAIDALDEAGAQAYITYAEMPVEIELKRLEIDNLRNVIKEAVRKEDYRAAAMLREDVKRKEIEVERMISEWKEEIAASRKLTITEDEIARVVSMMSQVPAQRMQQDEKETLRHLPETLSAKVIAQETAIQQITRAIQRSRLGLKSPNRPIGTFMFVGPTGVGKTHLAKSLAEEMFGTADALIRIDMSEYGEKHTGARLVGAPPGYVGYEEGGQLTEKVRRRPYSIILLDEIEKAHQSVFNMLLQVMDEGRMTDGNGVTVDFRNTIIIMTSNSGSRQLQDFGSGIGFNTTNGVSDEHIQSVTRKALQKQFAPEFLNRLDDIIMFRALNLEAAAQIVRLEFNALLSRMQANGMTLTVGDDVYEHIARTGFKSQYGARSLKRVMQDEIENPICITLMEHTGSTPTEVSVLMEEGKIMVNVK